MKTNEGAMDNESYIHSWEAAKSPMSIRSNGCNTHLTTYTRASQRTNSQSYCLVTSFETRRVSGGYAAADLYPSQLECGFPNPQARKGFPQHLRKAYIYTVPGMNLCIR